MCLDHLRHHLRVQEVTELLGDIRYSIEAYPHHTCIHTNKAPRGKGWVTLSVADAEMERAGCRYRWDGLVFVIVRRKRENWEHYYVRRSHLDEKIAEEGTYVELGARCSGELCSSPTPQPQNS